MNDSTPSAFRGYTNPPPGLTGEALTKWVVEEAAALGASRDSEFSARQKPESLPTIGLPQGLPPAAPSHENQRQARVEHKSSTRDAQEIPNEVFNEIPKEILNECGKSHTRDAPKGAMVARVHNSFSSIESKEKTSGIDLGRTFRSSDLWIKLKHLEKDAPRLNHHRLKFEYAQILKRARLEGLEEEEQRVMDSAARCYLPFADIEETLPKVLRPAGRDDAFTEALQRSAREIDEVDHLPVAFRRIATLAWYLQLIVGEADIYLPRKKVADGLKVHESVVYRNIIGLKETRWIVEVHRENRKGKTYVFYRCPSAVLQYLGGNVRESPGQLQPGGPEIPGGGGSGGA